MHAGKNILVLILFLTALLSSCKSDYSPKPRGYFRIDLPEHEYRGFDSTYPYTFDYPVYALLSPDPFSPEEPYWMNIDYPEHRGRIHLSYKRVNDNLLSTLKIPGNS